MKPIRRWNQFTFRTLWLALTVLCVGLGLDAHHGQWIRQRRAALNIPGVQSFSASGHDLFARSTAPGGLWLFGDRGRTIIRITVEPFPDDQLQRLRRLFPEAKFDVLHNGRYQQLPAWSNK
ncbi:MAG: hypothetical protein SGJ19_12920 [Planctomycetia bacterium]|nr:hypothetical protein [Planctomycetia bacterium]